VAQETVHLHASAGPQAAEEEDAVTFPPRSNAWPTISKPFEPKTLAGHEFGHGFLLVEPDLDGDRYRPPS
jgi:hypothetical protein